MTIISRAPTAITAIRPIQLPERQELDEPQQHPDEQQQHEQLPPVWHEQVQDSPCLAFWAISPSAPFDMALSPGR